MAQMRAIGGCAHPIYLAGHTTLVDGATGEMIRHYDTAEQSPGRAPIRCGNRRASVCPTCARVHAGDTYHLIRAGLTGGKGTPSTVGHPRLFVTLTAPSWGSVHRVSGRDRDRCRPRRSGGTCEHGRPVGCPQRHSTSDPAVGTPLCRDCYDYVGHVLWHAHAGLLWTRTTHAIRRQLATRAGVPQSRLGDHAMVSFVKTAEYQRRGAVHIHAVVRLDGPDGPGSPPPWDAELLAAAVTSALAVSVSAPYSPATGARVIRWGAQADVRELESSADTGPTADAVAAYIAKYVSKSVQESVHGVDYRITSAEGIRLAPVPSHIRAIMAVCWRLGGLCEFAGLRLRAWAHTLGYRGHILTKSRVYSTTFRELRSIRAQFRSGPTPIGAHSESEWRYVGSGHSPGESAIAAGIAEDIALSREHDDSGHEGNS
ncbi:plasmid replication initiator protein [Streptomyces uncialis]|nr:plasmid replication initiator protein [Streptomyces uncialis]